VQDDHIRQPATNRPPKWVEDVSLWNISNLPDLVDVEARLMARGMLRLGAIALHRLPSCEIERAPGFDADFCNTTTTMLTATG
jgi:hypothetical protein